MKMMEIYNEFSESMKAKKAGGSNSSQFFDVAKKVVGECVKEVATTYSKALTGVENRVRLCTDIEFNTLLSGFTYTGRRPTAFRDPYGRFLAIDVGGLLADAPVLESFIANFVMNVMEELVHEAFHSESEPDVKKKTYQLTGSYL